MFLTYLVAFLMLQSSGVQGNRSRGRLRFPTPARPRSSDGNSFCVSLRRKESPRMRKANPGVETSPLPAAARTPVVLGKYQLLDRLGQGGNGVVYRGLDTSLGRTVAVKLLPRHLSGVPGVVERFQREAQAAARVHHPNVVTIFEIAGDAEHLFLVLEYAPGGSAEDLLARQGRLSWPEATRIVRDACRGLAVAHQAGLIHRDIKPGNILLAADGLGKLADFGLAKDPSDNRAALTEPGYLVGTPLFMSPEQCRNEPLDERTDLYSLGATYYTLLTGAPPFPGQGVAVPLAHLSKPAPDPRSVAPDIPEACAAIIRWTMAKEPGQRPSNARELLDALDHVLALAAGWPTVTVPCPAAPPVLVETVQVRRARSWKWLLAPVALAVLLLVLYLVRGRLDRTGSNAPPRRPNRPFAVAAESRTTTPLSLAPFRGRQAIGT